MSGEMQILEHEGQVFKLGCLVPEVRPTTFSAYADSKSLMSRSAAIDVLQDAKRVRSRVRFAGVKWIWSQGQVGSCNGYAGAGALCRARVSRGLEYVKMSGESLYAQINGDVDRGSMLDDGMQALMKNGCAPADLVKWQTYRWKDVSPAARESLSRFKALECYRVDTEDELLIGLASGYQGVIAVEANNSFMKVDSEGRVSPTDGWGNHAVGVDDARILNGEVEFDMFNSWDLRYGVQGRGWVSWKRHLRTTSTKHAFYLIRSTLDDPKGDNPPELK